MKSISKTGAILAALAFAFAPLVPTVANAQSITAGVNTAVGVQDGSSAASFNASTTAGYHRGRVASSSQRRASTTAATEARIQGHSDTAISARITALRQISARLAGEKNLPASQLATLQASIVAEISQLTALETQIGSDTSTTTLRADASSITKGYRIYMLVIPQDKITSDADRVLAVAAQMQALSAKFAARISEAGAVDSSVTAAKADFDAKVADAQTQADAAVSAIAGLQPDNGDATLMASNTAALKGALADLRTAQSDLRTARQDAAIIVKGIEGKAGSSGSASTTASSNP